LASFFAVTSDMVFLITLHCLPTGQWQDWDILATLATGQDWLQLILTAREEKAPRGGVWTGAHRSTYGVCTVRALSKNHRSGYPS